MSDWKALPPWEKARLRWLLQTSHHPDPTRRRLDEHGWPKQVTPPGDWHTWLALSGRGFGKTRMGAEDCVDYARRHPGSRQALIGEDFGAGRDVMVEGESGILSVLPEACVQNWNRSIGQLTFANGSRADVFSADKPDDLRGPQFHRAWVDELAKMRYQRAVWDMLAFAMRLGDRPQVVVTTTPRPTELILELVGDPSTYVTRGSTYENADNLAESFLAQVTAKYEGRALGRQELYAELIMDYEGALVRRAWIEHVPSAPPLDQIAVAIDPSTWGPEAGVAYEDTGHGVETGIVAVGRSFDGDAFVLEDASMRGSPQDWASRALDLYHRLDADALVVEVNVGPWVISLLRGVEQTRGLPPARVVNVRPGRGEGKAIRLEPVAGLYELGQIKHVGHFPLLEDQLVSWDPRQRWSPDRIDALVHAVAWLEPWRNRAPAESGIASLRDATLDFR